MRTLEVTGVHVARAAYGVGRHAVPARFIPARAGTHVKVWDDNRGSMSVVTEARDGSLLWNFIPGNAKRLNRLREGVLLWPRKV